MSCKGRSGTSCMVSCISNYKQKFCVSFRLPKEPEKRKLWLKQIGIMHLDVDCKNHYRVCNLHFEGVMGLKDIKNRLKLNAVPILLLPEHPKANQSTGMALTELQVIQPGVPKPKINIISI